MSPTQSKADLDDDVAVTIRIPKSLFISIAPPPATVTQKTVERHFGITPRSYKAMVRDGLFPVKKIGKTIFASYDDVKRVVTEGAVARARVDRAVDHDAADPEALPMGPEEVVRYIDAARTPKEAKERRDSIRQMIHELHVRYDETLQDGSPNPNHNVRMQELASELRIASWTAKSVPQPPRTRRSRKASR